MDNTNKLQFEIEQLRKEIDSLSQNYFKNNFTGSQEFSKYSRFTNRLKVPSYSSTPTTCEVGEICEVSGVLKICSSSNTWTTVGSQV